MFLLQRHWLDSGYTHLRDTFSTSVYSIRWDYEENVESGVILLYTAAPFDASSATRYGS